MFINGADTKAAQIFTLAHVWLGDTALSDPDLGVRATNTVERWCNLVAAEVLVPLEAFRSHFVAGADLTRDLSYWRVDTGLARSYYWADERRVLREDHPTTLTTRRNLTYSVRGGNR